MCGASQQEEKQTNLSASTNDASFPHSDILPANADYEQQAASIKYGLAHTPGHLWQLVEDGRLWFSLSCRCHPTSLPSCCDSPYHPDACHPSSSTATPHGGAAFLDRCLLLLRGGACGGAGLPANTPKPGRRQEQPCGKPAAAEAGEGPALINIQQPGGGRGCWVLRTTPACL